MSWWAHHEHTAAHLDPGLQPERTAMAWSRTALACWRAGVLACWRAGVSAFTIRWLPFYGPGPLVLPALTLIAAVVIAITQQRRIRIAVAAIQHERLPVNPLPMLSLVAICWALGASSLILVALA